MVGEGQVGIVEGSNLRRCILPYSKAWHWRGYGTYGQLSKADFDDRGLQNV